MTGHPKFINTLPSFHAELKSRISLYFDKKGISTAGGIHSYFKSFIFLATFFGIYTFILFFTNILFLQIILSVILGFLIACIGFNVVHDGAHGSLSKKKSLNTLAAFTLNIFGGSHYMWNVKHNIIHHSFTNVDGIDDDLELSPFMRLCKAQKINKLHKYQHIYFWALYSFLYLFWILVSDYIKYFKGKIGEFSYKKMSAYNHFIFWGFKAFHLLIFVALPILTMSFLTWLICFLVYSLVAGLVLSIVFQLAHTVEHTHFPEPNKITGNMEDEWAIHQLKTTANFATNNKLISWFLGGLNFQIEHHLFPKISHIHYPEISKIVKQMCNEYGVEYIEYKRMRNALASHISYIKELGR